MNDNITESIIIRKANRLLIIRNIFLLALILIHFSIYFNFMSELLMIKGIIMAVCGALWLLFFIRYIVLIRKAVQDPYLKSAFQDEFFKTVKLKSGYHGFVGMLSAAAVLVIIGLISGQQEIPMLVPCEIILFSGILTSDISKIIQSRG